MTISMNPRMKTFDHYSPTRLIFGVGVLNDLHKYPMPGKKALIILDRDPFATKLGYVGRLQDQLKLAGCEYAIYDNVQPNPVLSTVQDGADFCVKNGCDFLIALGGGSTIDTAKGIKVVASNGGNLWDYIAGGSGGGKVVEKDTVPLITIATTAGTGSETGVGMVITKEETNEKGILRSPCLFPVLCFEDMELQESVPPKFTAFQGFDAFSHCVEGYISNRASLMSDMYDLTAIENAARYMPRAVRNGKDLEARERVAFAAILSGTSMAIAGTSSLHALEHALSGYHENVPHGAGLIMLSHAYHKRNIEVHVCDDRYIKMAEAMGKADADKPEDFLEMLDKLIENIDCSELKMSDYGVTPDEFEKFDENARFVGGGLFGLDRVFADTKDVVKIYSESYK